MQEVVFLSAARTAIGTFGGSFKDQAPTQLGALVINEAIKRAGVESSDIEQAVIGNVTHSEAADMYMSRVAAIGAGIPETQLTSISFSADTPIPRSSVLVLLIRHRSMCLPLRTSCEHVDGMSIGKLLPIRCTAR